MNYLLVWIQISDLSNICNVICIMFSNDGLKLVESVEQMNDTPNSTSYEDTIRTSPLSLCHEFALHSDDDTTTYA
jgi:hypothetical protein